MELPLLINILAISGSLRSGASHTAVLEAARLVAPPEIGVTLYRELAALPAFNPDLDTIEGDTLPTIVRDLRAQVGRADAVLLSSPEYAHGIPGAFKNLLDWLVGSVELPGKAVAVLDPSPWSTHVQPQLREVLSTMSVRLVPDESVTLALRRRGMAAAAIASDPELAAVLRNVLEALATASTSSHR